MEEPEKDFWIHMRKKKQHHPIDARLDHAMHSLTLCMKSTQKNVDYG